jgi:hypothetical protein
MADDVQQLQLRCRFEHHAGTAGCPRTPNGSWRASTAASTSPARYSSPGGGADKRSPRSNLPSRDAKLQVVAFLQRIGFDNLHNLQGGIDAWARNIDPAVPVY